MLNKIGFTECASKKSLSAEVIDQDRIRFFMHNRADEQRMHVDASREDAKMLLLLLSENLNEPETVGECEAEPMLPAGEWKELDIVQRKDLYNLEDRINRHLTAEVESFYRYHPELKIDYRFQVEATRRV